MRVWHEWFQRLVAIIITLLCCLLMWLIMPSPPKMPHSRDTNIHTCIHNDDRHKHCTLDAGEGNIFDVYWVANSQANCLNPYFPSIHIQASKPHNAWIHMVYTDSKAPEWRTFIDAANVDNSVSTYPFYTYEQDFYDAPLWTYSVCNKPLGFWTGHAFAVKVDHHKKSIHCIGGIAWGFELSYVRWRPKAIVPQLLKPEDWEKAWPILKEKLPGYTHTDEIKR